MRGVYYGGERPERVGGQPHPPAFSERNQPGRRGGYQPMRCKHCDTEQGCGSDEHGTERCTPACYSQVEHCGDCPPWICDDCHETTDAAKPCRCWISLADMPLADIKALFAADGGFDLSPPRSDDAAAGTNP